ncbi:gluconokinase [Pokkaliibacter sp. CJK22405]|uniref:gluconokinase n=1 Tax=Pokkaliibacter sp. CJK22405 TaxID=3384615 RepID=UPI003985055A
MKPPVIVVMGVSGCGKSSIGMRLAGHLGVRFEEGDSYHPQSNVEKMSRGIPLDDDDRKGWLEILAGLLGTAHQHNEGLILSCSALKARYRDLLRASCPGLQFVYLQGSFDTISERMAARAGHFMPTSLLESQFNTLEEPTGEPGVVTCDVQLAPEVLVEEALQALTH